MTSKERKIKNPKFHAVMSGEALKICADCGDEREIYVHWRDDCGDWLCQICYIKRCAKEAK